MNETKKHLHNEGFSLVEIVLALMVVAIGLLAVFGLMGDSLSANTKTRDDTIAATFAESVFSSIFASDWDVLAGGKEMDVVMGSEFWPNISDDPNDPIVVPTTEPQTYKLRYKPEGADAAIDYYPLQYDLKIESQRDAWGNEVGGRNGSYHADAVWRALRLKVWIGEFADTDESDDVYEFYNEQYRFIDPREEYESGNPD